MLIQADKFGSSVAQALRVQSDSMRTRRRQLAEEKAAKTAVKLIFPLVLFIFPGIFVVLVGPAAIPMVREMFPRLQGRSGKTGGSARGGLKSPSAASGGNVDQRDLDDNLGKIIHLASLQPSGKTHRGLAAHDGRYGYREASGCKEDTCHEVSHDLDGGGAAGGWFLRDHAGARRVRKRVFP